MSNHNELIDDVTIRKLVTEERLLRDRAQFDKVATYYEPEAYVRTTWFQGSAADYIAQSAEIAATGRKAMHPMWPGEIKINGDRATAESMSEIRNRNVLEGVEIDVVSECRFFSRLRRHQEGWKIASFEAIYIRDRFIPVRPDETLPIDWERWACHRPSYRSLAYIQEIRGYTVSQELLGEDRPDLLEHFYSEAEQWLLASGD